MRFAEIYTTRLGAGISLPSSCASVAFNSQPPVLRAVTNYGQGLAFRFVLTPQVWGVTGDGVSLSFDGRTVDFSNTTAEVAHSTTIGIDPVRFTIVQPVAGGIGLDYARFATLSVPAGATRDYQCAIGITTQAADLATSPSGSYTRTTLSGTAYVRDGTGSRAYTIRAGSLTAAIDTPARRVTITFQLLGTPASGGGATIDLGSFSAIASIDSTTDNFVAPLNSSTRSVTGTISGRLFGRQAIELGASFGGTVTDAGAAPGYTVIGTLHSAR